MQVAELLDKLGYRGSPNFLSRRQSSLAKAPDFGHIFRHAKANLALQGVYTLRPSDDGAAPVVPVVYVCKAASDDEASRFHRLVWNQDVVPFLIVHTPAGIRLYSGFRHRQLPNGTMEGVLRPLADFNDIADLIEDFHAESIDSGRLWQQRAEDVTPECRVDWRLLDNLKSLDRWLCSSGLAREQSHALIGKYVYLHYLRDRGILSPKKLERWGMDESAIFGRHATLNGLRSVVEQLDDWLNGSVFPLDLDSRTGPSEDQLRCVAGVFDGDDISEVGNRQLSLDFGAYDFSYIPMETLSVVYEQFLHAPDKPDAPSRGRQIGAYYTPIPVVNLMLSELEERRPLRRGMRILDPSCGSGAFLVQCYRRLVEQEFPPGSQPKPGQLRDLLQASIFGVDAESDACNVTELSLILTLLDYVDPPDLEGRGRSGFKLPVLRGRNIFCANFFDLSSSDRTALGQFDWIVGNPPWKKLNPKKLREHEPPVWRWMQSNDRQRPVGGNQAAWAFAWEVLDYLSADGEVGMFLPAMPLFENPARDFREAFFRQVKVNTVVNFSNLAEVLSAGRFRVPAAALFYELRAAGDHPSEDEFVRTYSPLVANQEPTRPVQEGTRTESWSIVINASEIRDLPWEAIAGGSGLPWKLATWGSSLDQRLLRKLERQFPSLRDLEDEQVLVVAEGPSLEEMHVPEGDRRNIKVDEVVGKNTLDMGALARWRHVFSFPESVKKKNQRYYASVWRGTRGLSICRGPHVIVSAARTFAVYYDEYLVVPPRQIGIVSPTDDKTLLKALSLYLSSDFAFYHQFLSSTEFGVKRDRATLRVLREMPIGITNQSESDLDTWEHLHRRLVATGPRTVSDSFESSASHRRQLSLLPQEDGTEELDILLAELNQMVSESLKLDDRERALIHDLVHVRLALNDGKTERAAVRQPTPDELQAYARRLQSELDDFIDGQLNKRHNVFVLHDNLSGMIQVNLVPSASAARSVTVAKADESTGRQLERTRQRLRDQRSQWVYFDRNLRIYEGRKTFIFKPMQRIHWTESQAMIDAREIIAETLAAAKVQA